jgi:phosphoenolpyruvate phosphomutase
LRDIATATGAARATTVFRALLTGPGTTCICEAHNALSAKIVEEAGFPAIWASGLTISAQAGLRDKNEASWTQVLDHLEFMADAVSVPILVDGDTGHGDYNNFSRLVRKLEQRGIASVCIEDKCFPKTNSFVRGTEQPLAPIDEFAGKLKAGKDAQQDADFTIIARVEAFIAGLGLDEALRRAEAYHAAGADGILIHSARSTPDEVLAFKAAWGDRCPVVIVPTKYYATPTPVFEQTGFSILIWANQILRAAVRAMRDTAERIHTDRGLTGVEDAIAPIGEIFRLQGEHQMEAQAARYLPRSVQTTQAIILAASRGSELGELTADRPKAMVPVAGVPLLQRIVSAYRRAGVQRLTVVRGYAAATVDVDGVEYADNVDWETNGEVASLAKGLAACAEEGAGDLLVSYGDVLFRRFIVEQLLETPADWSIAVDTHWYESVNRGRDADYVHCSRAHTRADVRLPAELCEVASAMDETRIHGEWMGFLRISRARRRDFSAILDRQLQRNPRCGMPDLLNALVAAGEPVRVLYSTGNWLDIDSLADLVAAGSF